MTLHRGSFLLLLSLLVACSDEDVDTSSTSPSGGGSSGKGGAAGSSAQAGKGGSMAGGGNGGSAGSQAGSGGSSAGAGGKAGQAGSAGQAGASGSAGSQAGGSAGQAGEGGSAGSSAGSAGEGGSAGQAGSAGAGAGEAGSSGQGGSSSGAGGAAAGEGGSAGGAGAGQGGSAGAAGGAGSAGSSAGQGGSAGDAGQAGAAGEGGSAGGGGSGGAALCEEYPIPWPAAAGAEAKASAELATIAPDAKLTWDDNTGTLSSIFQLNVPLTGCTKGQDVNAQVAAFLSAHPALFQMDLTEWNAPPPYGCEFVSDQVDLLNMGRQRIASHAVQHDIFAYSIKRVGGVVTLATVNGTYLPTAYEGLDALMSGCNQLTAGAAKATALATALPAKVYFQCAPKGDLTYTPHENDTFALAPAESWTWEEGSGQALLSGMRTLRVTVNPANYTDELLDSDARCPVTDPESNDFTVGFDITFDVRTGEILSIKPGLDCIVC